MGKPPRPADESTRIGRPRVYETAAEKLDAFRQRQASAGYLRREVLVTEEVAERMADLAREHGVSAGDVGSAMIEFGLEHYGAEGGARTSRVAAAAVAAQAPPVHEDPIRAFFRRRKGDPP
ncbi:hypothetical protein BH09PSE6_BH09PSE6_21980 [soil metagenome]